MSDQEPAHDTDADADLEAELVIEPEDEGITYFQRDGSAWIETKSE